MTSKDKPTRPGGKSAGRDKKPHFADKKGAAPKKAAGAKASGPKSFGAKGPGRGFDAKTSDPKAGASRPARERPAAAAAAADEPQRISKILARAGVASRRDVERMIMEGRIRLNGVILDTPVVNATLADAIEVDGQPIRGIERTRLWLYHKPAGLVTTNADPEGRPTVFENLPDELPRVLSIGRLDINTEGLLLLTNDGGLARVLELPSTGWLRRYRVRAHGEIDQEALDKLKDGIAVDGVLYGAIEATLDRVQGSNVWITMGLREGKNREIKNVLGALGLDVNRLIRISYGPFQLGELPEGHVQEIRGRTLRDQLGPRLIEDAKANFDAPLYNDQAATVAGEAEDDAADTRRPERNNRWEKPEDKRERALSRLDTRRDDRRDGGGRGKDGARGKGGPREDRDAKFEDRPKRAPAQRARTANVWMAPGARPLAEKKPKSVDGDATEKSARRERPESAPKSKRYGRNKDGLATKTTGKFDPDRKGGPHRDFDRADRPASAAPVKRRDDEGEWISASEPARRGKDEGRDGGFGRRKSGDAGDRRSRDHGDRPARRDGGDRPRSEGGPRSYSDKPRAPRADGDRPQRREGGERSFSDRPARSDGGDRRFDKPRAPRADGDRPPRREGGDRPFGDKPRGKSFGGKPSGGKSFGERSGGPRGGKPGGGKPGGGRPGGPGRSGGGRPAGGGKPRGRGN
ncbi:pseudouridine synthase [Ensifer sp. SL37]|uniref:pseudouridine synthase n=1 Tax=Ensifer sp. SL37 TaxID=2995137 RepID=UPI0022757ACA|nr:pseudouridine synthase [Ensifer sp. SL37]MCY1741735.1 pseudouridine synthase [Ensifer sp. SL37]